MNIKVATFTVGEKSSNTTYSASQGLKQKCDIHIPWSSDMLCARQSNRVQAYVISGIIELLGNCNGGNLNIHIWAWFGYFNGSRREIGFYIYLVMS